MSRSKPVQQESASKRLRNVYFALYEKDSEGFKDFDSYYNNKMEKLINHFKKLI